MTRVFWKRKLLPWLEPNEELNKLGGDSYGLKGKLKVCFWFEGGLKITGNQKSLSLNLKDPDLLVLSTLVGEVLRTYRIPYSRLVCFELIRGSGESGEIPEMKFFRN